MTSEFLRWLGYGTLVYFILMQTYLVLLAVLSGFALRRNHHIRRFSRIGEMLSSRSTPPLSIVIPAYNEAAGIVDAVRSMSIVKYPRFEIVITNDGSTDRTLDLLIEAFRLEVVRIPYRPDLDSKPVRAIYRGRSGVEITVLDKENGGRADALNAGINAARYPYVLCTDADVILDPDCLVRSMHRVVEDRELTVGVGGNVRPINGSRVELGHLIEAGVPRALIPRMQILEYVRTFLASRPAWSAMNALPIVSGAFGVWKKSVVVAVGGFTVGHMGEDMDLTMRIHRHHLERKIPYRIVYEPAAVIWTEVPDSIRVLRRQRIRWHRGLMTAVRDFLPMTFNPRYRQVGMVSWGGFFLFEYLAPIIEFVGWFAIPTAWLLGALNTTSLGWMILIAYGAGLVNSLLGLLLDESYGYFNSPRDTSRLLVMAIIENLGLRQMTVLWRMRALVGGEATRSWGNMERRGVANLAKSG
ncbi:MAG: glycosyltransferase [Acidimicrobiia bacterium]|jgi:cellulose synthase/poly-beta-1,6-N-acetylglucosamine synthase-like glycosyltransferase